MRLLSIVCFCLLEGVLSIVDSEQILLPEKIYQLRRSGKYTKNQQTSEGKQSLFKTLFNLIPDLWSAAVDAWTAPPSEALKKVMRNHQNIITVLPS